MSQVYTSAVERACIALAEAAPVRVRTLSVGPKTAVYRVLLGDGRKTVAKLFSGDCSHDAVDESRLLTAIAALGRIAVPTVIGSGSVPGFAMTALLTTDVGATTLGQAVREREVPRSAALGRLARLLTTFHTIGKPLVSLGPGIAEQIGALGRYCPSRLFARINPALDVITERTAGDRHVWCHGDLHLDNVILPHVRDRSPARGLPSEYVVDLEASTVCVPEYDVAQTLVTCDALAPADRLSLSSAYGRPIDFALLDAFTVFQAVRGWTYAAHREGRHQEAWRARLQWVFNRWVLR